MELKEKLLKTLPNAQTLEGLAIKPIYDVASNKLHYQTEPYLTEDGRIVVKRLASFDVEVEKAFSYVEEYDINSKESGAV